MVPTKNTIDLDRRLANSQPVVYPDAGHGGVFQFHEDFVKRALEFLRAPAPPHTFPRSGLRTSSAPRLTSWRPSPTYQQLARPRWAGRS